MAECKNPEQVGLPQRAVSVSTGNFFHEEARCPACSGVILVVSSERGENMMVNIFKKCKCEIRCSLEDLFDSSREYIEISTGV